MAVAGEARSSDGREVRASAFPPELATFLLVEATPHAGVLGGRERPFETFTADGTIAADRFGAGRLRGYETRCPHREEELGIRVPAERVVAPAVVGCPQGEA